MPTARYDLLPVGSNGKRRHTHLEINAGPWRAEANCRDLDPDLFYPPSGAQGRLQVANARAICDGCTVRIDCLAYALAAREELGIWGGTTERQRRWLRGLLRTVDARETVAS